MTEDPAVFKNLDGSVSIFVDSETDSSKNYIVKKSSFGKITCTCEHYRRRLKGKGKLCKHAIKLLKERKLTHRSSRPSKKS